VLALIDAEVDALATLLVDSLALTEAALVDVDAEADRLSLADVLSAKLRLALVDALSLAEANWLL
jgi:hypothetical protein